MITINGVILPAPSVYNISRQDLDSENSGRNERGVMIRDRLRSSVIKGTFEWWAVDNAKANLILNAVEPSKVTAKLLVEGTYSTKSMYVSDRSSDLVRYMGKTSKMAWNIGFSLVEY